MILEIRGDYRKISYMIYTDKNVMHALTFMKNINESDIIKSRPVETDCVTSTRKIIAVVQ